jgi:hypothetical protein
MEQQPNYDVMNAGGRSGPFETVDDAVRQASKDDSQGQIGFGGLNRARSQSDHYAYAGAHHRFVVPAASGRVGAAAGRASSRYGVALVSSLDRV